MEISAVRSDQADDADSGKTFRGWRTALIAAAVAAVAGLLGVFTLPVLDRDEARYAQATAQMLQTGDFVRITFLDEDRNKKPVGIHWLQSAAVAATTGEAARAIWAYRLPSVLGAMLAALAAALIAGRLLGGRAGLYAGALLGASVLMGAEAGIAKTDAMLAGATGLALYGLLRLCLASPDDRRTRRTWALAVWALLGLGVLIKGPVAPFVLGVSAGALVMLDAWSSRTEGGRRRAHAVHGLAQTPRLLAGTGAGGPDRCALADLGADRHGWGLSARGAGR